MHRFARLKIMLSALFLCMAPVALAPLVTAAEPPVQPTSSDTHVDINSADAEEIAAVLDGVGLTRAREIVMFREMNGMFMSVDDLEEVNGIGPATIERNRQKILINTE
ncbi:MAG: ComEA family DNA-binding protein [Pseudohongiellaceae bacterium]